MVHCGIWNRWIVGFVRWVYWDGREVVAAAISAQDMMTSSMETFAALLAICAGNSPVPGEFPTQRPVTRSFDVFFDLHPNKRLSKQWWGWWFETLSCPLWRHRNETSPSWHGYKHRTCHSQHILRVDSRFASSQWETASQSNTVSHWLSANLESDTHRLSNNPVFLSINTNFAKSTWAKKMTKPKTTACLEYGMKITTTFNVSSHNLPH